MVGKHVARFQAELSLAKKMASFLKEPRMPYGYPMAVYHPLHICQVPQVRKFVARNGGLMSNGVPRVLRTEWVNGTLLGVYNPRLS
jgi:hypothetical protein